MENELINLLHGFLVGFIVSVPLGPAGLFSVQRTISKGRMSGFTAGMGAAFSDTLFAGLALVSLAFIQDFINSNKIILLILGGAVVCGVGIKIYLTNPIKQLRSNRTTKRYWEDLLAGFFMTVTNPGALLMLIAVFTILGVSREDCTQYMGISTILLGVLAGAGFWWYFLSSIINRFRRRFRLRQLWSINRISGIIILALGFISMLNGLWKLILPLVHK